MEQGPLCQGEGDQAMRVLTSFDRLLDQIEKGQIVFCEVSLAGIAVVTFLEVFLRNALGINLQWALELSALLTVWICFIGASVVYRRKGHIGIEALVSRFPESLQSLLNFVMLGVIAVGFVVLILKAFSLMIVQRGQEIVSLGISRCTLSLPLVIGVGLMVLNTFELLKEELKRFPPWSHPQVSKRLEEDHEPD